MNPPHPIKSPGAPDRYERLSHADRLEADASLAAGASAGALGALKLAAVVVLGLLVWPPLAVLVFLIVAPALVVALVLGLLAAVLSTPYLLVHHFRGDHGGHHLPLIAHRLRRAARALFDLAPHRIVADARKIDSRQ
jgi:hypothetical protein